MERLYIIVLINPVFIVDRYAIFLFESWFTIKDGVERQYTKLFVGMILCMLCITSNCLICKGLFLL